MDNQWIIHNDRLTRLETLLEVIRDEYLETIREQVTRTNGRVTALELRSNITEQRATRHSAWIAFLWIAVGVVGSSLGTLFAAHVFAK